MNLAYAHKYSELLIVRSACRTTIPTPLRSDVGMLIQIHVPPRFYGHHNTDFLSFDNSEFRSSIIDVYLKETHLWRIPHTEPAKDTVDYGWYVV